MLIWFNPFQKARLSHSYQWGKSISMLGLLGEYFHFIQILIEYSVRKPIKTLIRRRVLRHLILVCTVCLCATISRQGFYSLNFM